MIRQARSCPNFNHGRGDAPVRFCPDCGEVLNEERKRQILCELWRTAHPGNMTVMKRVKLRLPGPNPARAGDGQTNTLMDVMSHCLR